MRQGAPPEAPDRLHWDAASQWAAPVGRTVAQYSHRPAGLADVDVRPGWRKGVKKGTPIDVAQLLLELSPVELRMVAEDLWARCETRADTGCIEWRGGSSIDGRGRLNVGGTLVSPYRVAWVLTYGPIPRGHGTHGTCVCHHCDNPRCVNPAHLFLGSMSDNMRDAARKGRIGKRRREPA